MAGIMPSGLEDAQLYSPFYSRASCAGLVADVSVVGYSSGDGVPRP